MNGTDDVEATMNALPPVIGWIDEAGRFIPRLNNLTGGIAADRYAGDNWQPVCAIPETMLHDLIAVTDKALPLLVAMSGIAEKDLTEEQQERWLDLIQVLGGIKRRQWGKAND